MRRDGTGLGPQRTQTLSQAAATVTAAADEIRRVAGSDPQAAQARAQAAADPRHQCNSAKRLAWKEATGLLPPAVSRA